MTSICKTKKVDGFLGYGISHEREPDVIRQIMKDAKGSLPDYKYYKMSEVKPADSDLERIKSIIVKRIKRDGIQIKDYWLTFILALFGREMFNENEMREIVEELKKRIEDE